LLQAARLAVPGGLVLATLAPSAAARSVDVDFRKSVSWRIGRERSIR
jgi:hypothetical protein